MRVRHSLVLARDDLVLPFDAGEVDAPLVAVVRRGRAVGEFPQGRPGDGDFDRPAGVAIGRIVQRAVDVDGRFEAGDVPAIVGPAAVFVRPWQEEVPAGVERVHLEFVVLVIVAVGIDEEFEIVVVEDDRIVLGERPPDMRFFQLRGDIEIFVVPQQLGAGAEPRLRPAIAFDVDEIIGPGSNLPSGVVQASVDLWRRLGAIADVSPRDDAFHSRPIADPIFRRFGQRRGSPAKQNHEQHGQGNQVKENSARISNHATQLAPEPNHQHRPFHATLEDS